MRKRKIKHCKINKNKSNPLIKLFESMDKKQFVKWLIKNKNYTLETANIKHASLKEAYMKGNKEDLII